MFKCWKQEHSVCKKMAVILLVSFFLTMVVPLSGGVVNAFTDPSNMTDQDFFGVWNGSSWTTAGKINYSYSTNLALVENAVKASNYETAKTELLNYFKNRTSRTAIPFPSRNTPIADLACDDILTGYNEYYVDTFTINNTFQTVEADVLSAVTGAMRENKQMSIYLMGRKKEQSLAEFYSKENANNKPVLEVTVGLDVYVLNPVKDTYIRPGTYGNINYGADTLLNVEDWGVPFGDDTRRTYLQFDLSSIPDSPTSAELKLYGRNASGTGDKDIIIFRLLDTAWEEAGTEGLAWNNTLANTFSWQGVAAGCDWNQPSSGADIEWMYTITRFEFAKSIAYEYNQTSNESYSYNLLRLMLDFINDKTATYSRSLDTAVRATNWVRSYNYLKNSSSMDSSANAAILKDLWQVADWLISDDPDAYHPASNWGVTETKGLYDIAVYFPEFLNSANWQSIANSRAEYLITTLVYSDGSYTEGSIHYARSAAESFYGIKKMGELNLQTFSTTFDDGMKSMGKYLMNTSFPNGYDPQLGDADYNDHKSFVLNVGNTYNDSNLIYFGSDGSSGVQPANTSISYPVHKSAVMRTGWQDSDLYLHINNNKGKHEHPDQMSLIAYGYGRPLLIDPGRDSYAIETVPYWLRYSTEAHNTIEINDTKQDTSKTNIVESWMTNNQYDFMEGYTDATAGFRHYRSVLFIKCSYWIVSDYVTGTGTNKFEQNWHMLPMANATLDSVTQKVKTNFGDSNGDIQVIPADPANLTASLKDGYYSSAYLNISDAKYATYTKNITGNVSFDTVLYPTASGDNRDVRVSRLVTTPDAPSTTATALKIELDYGNSGNIGYYYLTHESVPITTRVFDEYSFDGEMAYIEKDSANNLQNIMIKSGMTLKRNSTELISSDVTVKELAVKWNGTILEIDGNSGLVQDTDTGRAIAIYAPAATSVTLNGDTIPYTRNGDYIYAVRQHDDTQYLVNESFNNGTTGNQPLGWTITTDPDTNCSIAEVPGATDKSMKLYDNSSAGWSVATMSFIPQIKTVTAEWKFMEGARAGCWPVFALVCGNSRATEIYTANGPVLCYKDGSNVEHTIQSISPDTWYTVRIVANITTNTYDIYIDGTLKVSGAQFRTAKTSIDGIRFSNGYGPTGTVYINDVKVMGYALENDNFNSGTTGGQPTGWTITADTDTSCTIVEVPGVIDKSMRLYDNNTAGWSIATNTFAPQADTVIAEWRFMEGTRAGSWPVFALMSGDTRATEMYTANGPVLGYKDSSNVEHTIQSISPDTWYTIRIVADIATNTYDIYVDGALKVTGAPFRRSAISIDGIRFSNGYGPTGTVYINDVRVGGLTVACDNFNNGITGNQPSGWTVTTDSDTSCTIAEVPDTTDKSMKLYDNNSSGWAIAVKSFEAQTDTITAEWKFMEQTNAGCWPVFSLMSGDTRATEMYTASGPVLGYKDGSDGQHTIQGISSDTWYSIKLVVNIQTNTYDIYVDGILKVTGAPFRKPVTSINSIRFSNGYGPNGTVYINDLKVSKSN